MKNLFKKAAAVLLGLTLVLSLSACGMEKTEMKSYKLNSSVEVAGRQGVAYENGFLFVSGSTTLTKYDENGKVIAENLSPFDEGFELEANHIGDIDVFQNEIFCGVEHFLDGEAKNIQIAVYDGDTLKLKRSFNFEPDSGQTECSGITVNPDDGSVWMCSWADGESGRYLYKYDLESGKYLGKVHLHPVPQWIQGVAYHDGAFYITADDGNADFDEPDHVYKCVIAEGDTHCRIEEEKTLDDVIRQGEIEGLTFNEDKNQLIVLYNRGARIILGMPSGFYEGYDSEIHEIFIYDIV